MHPFQSPPIRTDRLVLRPLTEADVPALFEIHADPQAMRYWSAPVWRDAQRGRDMVARDADPALTDHLRLGIELAESGTLVGTCTLFDISTQCRRAELGYMLSAAAWGRGLMREALRAFLDHAFTVLDLNRIEADTDPRNDRSMRLLERLGFVREGHFRERWIVGGEVSDAAMYGLLRRDWQAGAGLAGADGALPREAAHGMPLSQVLASSGYVRVPLQRSEVGHFHARGRLRGRDVSVLVDTGASSTLVSLALARDLGLALSLHPDKGGGAGGAAMDVFVVEGADLELDPLAIRPRHLLAMDLSHANEALVANGAAPIDAILGLDVFEAQGAVIDYVGSSLFLRP
jgi:[ribosomal protein S5]-alanine N-acetyltransferase